MTITARYAGRCRRCGGRIEPGQQIEWDRATRATSHVRCSAVRPASTRPAQPAARAATRRCEAPSGPRLVRKQGASPFRRGEILAAQLTDAEVAELEKRQGFAAVPVPPQPGKAVPDGCRLVAVRVVWATSLSADEVEDLDAWGEAHQAVIELATAEAAASLVAERQALAKAAERQLAWGKLWTEVWERGTGTEKDVYDQPMPGTVVYDTRASGTGRALSVDGDRLIARRSTGYDMYIATQHELEDPALAARARELAQS